MNNEKKDWSAWFGISGIVIIACFFVLAIIDNTFALLGLYGFVIGCILIFIGVVINKMEDAECEKRIKENEKIIEKNKEEMSEWFDSKIKEYNINTDDVIPIRIKEYSIYLLYKYYYWLKDKKLFLFPQKEDFIRLQVSANNSAKYCEENVKLTSINISDIIYFKSVGDISYTTSIESTGTNVKGAVIGAAIAGDAGAVIGSRPQIKSKMEKIDNRNVELKYKDDGAIKTLRFAYAALDIFRDIFPEKEYEYAEFKPESLDEKDSKTVINSTLEEKFEKLRNLKNAGLITEEEFSDKKKELLKQL